MVKVLPLKAAVLPFKYMKAEHSLFLSIISMFLKGKVANAQGLYNNWHGMHILYRWVSTPKYNAHQGKSHSTALRFHYQWPSFSCAMHVTLLNLEPP